MLWTAVDGGKRSKGIGVTAVVIMVIWFEYELYVSGSGSPGLTWIKGRKTSLLSFVLLPANKQNINIQPLSCVHHLDLSWTFCFMSKSISEVMSRSRYSDSCSVAFSRSFWLSCSNSN